MSNNEPNYVNASGAYQGDKYFSYDGKVQNEMRKEKECLNT